MIIFHNWNAKKILNDCQLYNEIVTVTLIIVEFLTLKIYWNNICIKYEQIYN